MRTRQKSSSRRPRTEGRASRPYGRGRSGEPFDVLRTSILSLLLALTSACTGHLSSTAEETTPTPPPPDGIDSGIDSGSTPIPTPPSLDPLDGARVFYLGHSLQNHQVPAMVEDLARSAGVENSYQVQIGIGANLQWQWMHPEGAEGSIARDVLPVTPFDAFVMTEAIPLETQIRWADSVGYATQYADLARQGNPDVQVYLYETWHSRNDSEGDAAWRARITTDLPLWESIVTGTNERFEGRDLRLIPAGQAMGMLFDEITAGRVPGITSIDQVFHDDIHLNDVGWYFIACVQYAGIYHRSPVGLTSTTSDHEGTTTWQAPPSGAVAPMQEIAWRAVTGYPHHSE